MTQKRKALMRLRDARGRLRDMEAARTTQAAAQCDERARELVEANRDLVTAVVRACERLAAARAIAELEAVHLDLGSARDQVADARKQVVAATEVHRVAAEHLSRRERELRATERVLENVTSEERREGDRREQSMVDDLVGARLARRDP